MVHTRTSDFTLDVPEGSGAHAGAPLTGPRRTALTSPLLSPPPLSIEQLLATQNELMQVLTENLMH
jgi:hypothetical protein